LFLLPKVLIVVILSQILVLLIFLLSEIRVIINGIGNNFQRLFAWKIVLKFCYLPKNFYLFLEVKIVEQSIWREEVFLILCQKMECKKVKCDFQVQFLSLKSKNNLFIYQRLDFIKCIKLYFVCNFVKSIPNYFHHKSKSFSKLEIRKKISF